ncbi:MAG: methyltransferase domain-containing protein [Nitrospirota bacterium]
MYYSRISKKLKEMLASKQEAESLFWEDFLCKLEQWYRGDIPDLFKTPCPREEEKIRVSNIKDSSVLTWFKLHQQVKYLKDLQLTDQAFSGMRLLDIGAGPMPSATVFKSCKIYCLEPLLHDYLRIGFPFHYYDDFKYIHANAENIPVEDGFFDAVISVNAIDHVDNLNETSLEIRRVLKDNGLFRMHVHYHKATKWEPMVITDEVFSEAFSWCKNLHKIAETKTSYGLSPASDETFVLWSNFNSS